MKDDLEVARTTKRAIRKVERGEKLLYRSIWWRMSFSNSYFFFHAPMWMFVLVQEREGRLIWAVDVVDGPDRESGDNNNKHSSAARNTQSLSAPSRSFCCSLLSLPLSLSPFSLAHPHSVTLFPPFLCLSFHVMFSLPLPRCFSVSLSLPPLSFLLTPSPAVCPPSFLLTLSLSVWGSLFGYSIDFCCMKGS